MEGIRPPLLHDQHSHSKAGETISLWPFCRYRVRMVEQARQSTPARAPITGSPPPSHTTDSPLLAAVFRAEELAGLKLATQARGAALSVLAVWIFISNRSLPSLYYFEASLLLFILSGLAHYLSSKHFDWLWLGPLFILLDFSLLTGTLLVLNSYLRSDWPPAFVLHVAPFAYFFLLGTASALSYAPRLMIWTGIVGALCWSMGIVWVSMQPDSFVENPFILSPQSYLALHPNANFVNVGAHIEQLIVFLLFAGFLAVVVWRSRRLVIRQTEAARERANLARYFSPTMVDELAGRDEPLGPIRRQDVAVMFVDIVGFTPLAESMPPEQVMTLLRDFHGRMEAEVFSHHGTLEKFIGDALLATFGVPDQGKQDATDALSCGYAMLASLETWNAERTRRGEIPIQIGIGLHFGPAVLGDIGSQRNMAFAVIGDTVNTTSRLQTLTRDLETPMVISDTLVQAVRQEVGDQADRLLHGLRTAGPQALRGREERVAVRVLASPVEEANGKA